jgi:hypothetical protein
MEMIMFYLSPPIKKPTRSEWAGCFQNSFFLVRPTPLYRIEAKKPQYQQLKLNALAKFALTIVYGL